MAVVRYLPVEEFDHLGRLARQMGFTQVASGPFVRSSYHARDMVDGGGTLETTNSTNDTNETDE
jgi:lipoate synthase